MPWSNKAMLNWRTGDTLGNGSEGRRVLSIQLKDAAIITTGKLDANEAVNNGKYPFFTCGAKPLAINEYAFDEDAILLAGNNAHGVFHINRYKGKFNAYQRTYVLTAKDGYDVDFIRYSIEQRLKQLKRSSQGSQTKFLTMPLLESLELDTPPKWRQEQTASVLACLDKATVANRAINDNLQSILQALYGYWFMQFNFPDVNGRPYRSSGGRMSYNEKLGCSIPEGWHVASIVNNPLTDVITPGVDLFKTKTYYATADVNGIDIGMGSSVDYETRESRANMQPGLHTVWFAKMKNSVKHLFLGHSMKRVIDDSILSTGFMGLQCKKVAFEYISAFIDGPYFERAKDQYANGATQQAVGNAELESVYLVIPDDETLARFHNLTRGLVESIGETIIENKKLVELRDWLLPMLMNGQASVEAMQPNYRLPDC